jgi:hypothetical protein
MSVIRAAGGISDLLLWMSRDDGLMISIDGQAGLRAMAIP